ncbi:MAG: catabolite control protein A [Firmicutes bacterium]|nr:catabolite control protein A [Bacillota bacterium]
MKKLMSWMMTVLIVCTMMGCGQKESSREQSRSDGNNSIISGIDTSVQESSKESEKNSKEESTSTSEEESKQQESTVLDVFNKAPVISETVLYDQDGVKITATGLEYGNYSAMLELLFENNSEKDLEFYAGTRGYSCNAVNNYMFSGGYLSTSVTSGKKATDTMKYDYSSLQLNGINEIAELTVGFQIQDKEKNAVYTGPLQIKTSCYDTHDFEKDSFIDAMKHPALQAEYEYTLEFNSESVLMDSGNVSLVSECLIRNVDEEETLFLEFDNQGEELYEIAIRDIAINGILVSSGAWSYESINAGKKCITDIQLDSVLDSNFLEPLGIEEFAQIGFNISVQKESEEEPEAAIPVSVIIDGRKSESSSEGEVVYNQNDMLIRFMGIAEDDYEYSSDLYVLLIVSNLGQKERSISDVYNSLSVNGFMIDYSIYSTHIIPEQNQLFKVKLWESGLEKNKISVVEDITDVEFSLKLRDEKYKDIDQFTIKIDLNEESSKPEDKSSAESSSQTESVSESVIRPEVKAAIDEYESFMDTYIDFINNLDTTDLNALAKYGEMMSKYADFTEKFGELGEKDLTTAELQYYTEVLNRVNQKLISASGK